MLLNQQPNKENMYHDNFGVPLNGYDGSQNSNGYDGSSNSNGPTSRQDFDDGPPPSTGIRRPDSFNNFNEG